MAYVSSEKSKEIKEGVKIWGKKYNFKATVNVRNHSTVNVIIREGDYPYHEGDTDIHVRGGEVRLCQYHSEGYRNFIEMTGSKMWVELHEILNKGNWDKSDLMSDYFDVGWYAYIRIGEWDKPYFMRNSINYCSCGRELVKGRCPEHGKDISNIAYMA